MTDSFVINYINNKLAETSDINYIRYTFYELRVKNNLSEKDLDNFASASVFKCSKILFFNSNFSILSIFLSPYEKSI